MMIRFAQVLCLAGIMIASSLTSFAFEVQPMRHSIFPSNGQTTGLLTVRNTRSESLPVELIVEKRVFGEDSVQTLVPADDDFVIFPFQALIEPGATQAFRFQYIGDPTVVEESAYTIHVREVPVDLEGDFTGLRYVYSFGVVVYLEDRQAESQLSVSDVSRNDSVLSVSIENSGRSFARLSNDRISLTQGDQVIDLEGESLMSIIDQSVIPPNNKMPITLNLTNLDLAPGEISVSLRETPD